MLLIKLCLFKYQSNVHNIHYTQLLQKPMFIHILQLKLHENIKEVFKSNFFNKLSGFTVTVYDSADTL